jgi:hypothetical protein
MTLFRRTGRQLPDLPPVRPLHRDPEPPPQFACSCAEEMPPRPQSPHHRMPPEVAWQRWSGDVDGGLPFTTPPGGTRREFDPCGRPGPKITITARETT